jgi:hypothetical protein
MACFATSSGLPAAAGEMCLTYMLDVIVPLGSRYFRSFQFAISQWPAPRPRPARAAVSFLRCQATHSMPIAAGFGFDPAAGQDAVKVSSAAPAAARKGFRYHRR